MKKNKNEKNAPIVGTLSYPSFLSNSIIPYNLFAFQESAFPSASISLENNEQTSTTSFLNNRINVEAVKNVFFNTIENYDIENGELTENCLENLIESGKGDLFDILLRRADDGDYGFFKKFIDCYRFSNSALDEELIIYLTRFCFESSDYLLQLSGINLISSRGIKNNVDFEIPSINKITNPYLKNKLDLALKNG